MTATVYLIEARAEPAIDDVLGGLIDIGTTAELALHGPPLDSVAALCQRLDHVHVEHATLDATDLRARLELGAARDPVFAIVATTRAWVVTAGPALPSMGHAPVCDLAQLEASLRFALGDLDAQPRSLFSEPASLPAADERLMDRLRQLYGE
jgi:hypothetical protein